MSDGSEFHRPRLGTGELTPPPLFPTHEEPQKSRPLENPRRRFIIGVAGGTGSGKSTVARNVLEAVGPDNVTYLQQDSYYHDRGHLPAEVRAQFNFDHPDAFDNQLLVMHLHQLGRGESIHSPIYDFKTHARKPETEIKPARPVILVEGILIFAQPSLRDMIDIKIFVDTDGDIRIMRRLLRDVADRGRSMESVIDQYMKTVRPMHQEFVEPSKRHADIVIPEGGNNQVAMDMLITKIRSLLD